MNILNKSKNKKEKRIKPERGMCTIWDDITEEKKVMKRWDLSLDKNCDSDLLW